MVVIVSAAIGGIVFSCLGQPVSICSCSLIFNLAFGCLLLVLRLMFSDINNLCDMQYLRSFPLNMDSYGRLSWAIFLRVQSLDLGV